MTHLPFIVASYGIFLAVALLMAVTGMMRLRTATRRLDALDRRKAAP
jgi:uncharacterized integral membrane protein